MSFLSFRINRNIIRAYRLMNIRHRVVKKKVNIYKKKLQNINNDFNISAIIPSYNCASYLEERIDSILLQTLPVKELIILEDCSTDNSLEIIEEKIRNNTSGIPIKLIKNQINSGNVFCQWEKGFQNASGDYVWIAEADDSCAPTFLEEVMKPFSDHDLVVSYCESKAIDEENYILMDSFIPWIDIFCTGTWNSSYVHDGEKEVEHVMCSNNTIANVSSAVFRKNDYSSYFDIAKTFRLCGDWFMYINILRHGKIAYTRKALNFHRMTKTGVTLTTTHMDEYKEITRIQEYIRQNFNIDHEANRLMNLRLNQVKVRVENAQKDYTFSNSSGL